MTSHPRRKGIFFSLAVVGLVAGALCAWLLLSIAERKHEAELGARALVPMSENDADPELWAVNYPRQYDSYRLTAEATRTRFGGHGGSEALPEQKLERDPWLATIFAGYAFSLDYRDRRGHAYMLEDQRNTKRVSKPQSASCLHCHASVMPLYRELGEGDVQRGFEATHQMSYHDGLARLEELDQAHPVTCLDCHDPATMRLRVTRPGLQQALRELVQSEAPVPALPSVQRWREGKRDRPYDPNQDASRGEMRSLVCAQCHVEYYCASELPLRFPWKKGLRMEDLEADWNETQLPSGERFFDFRHATTGAPLLKAQHPEFELWSQGIHARSGVSCSDCHMPYIRDGASKVSDHWVRSPLLNVNRACQTCHNFPEGELLARVEQIQARNHELLQRGGEALVALIESIELGQRQGASEHALDLAREAHRQAQWRLDYIAAENSMGFHAPQEGARILAEAIDLARRGQVALLLDPDPPEAPQDPPS